MKTICFLGYLNGLLLLLIPAVGYASNSAKGSVRDEHWAANIEWKFAKCVVRVHPKEVHEILQTYYFEESAPGTAKKKLDNAKRLFKSASRCLDLESSYLSSSGAAAYGFLSGVELSQKYSGFPVPDYSVISNVYTQEEFQSLSKSNLPQVYVFLSFSECVFRNRPQQVIRLFTVEPYGPSADMIWKEIDPVLSECLPAKDGETVKLNRAGLLVFLGEAAYRVDGTYDRKIRGEAK